MWRSRAIEVSEKNNNQFYLTLNSFQRYISAGIYLLKLNYRNTRIKCETCSKLTLNTPEQHHWHRSGVFEHISHLVLVFLLLNLKKLLPARAFPKFETKSFNPLMPNVGKWLNTSSRLQMFFKIGVLEDFEIFTGKQLCWKPSLIKLET